MTRSDLADNLEIARLYAMIGLDLIKKFELLLVLDELLLVEEQSK